MRQLTKSFGAALFGLPILLSGASTIGTVVSDGRFNVNQMQAPGSATLFEGSLVESLKSAITIQLTQGTRIDLQAGSSGTVYQDHMVMRAGVARIRVNRDYRIETASLVLRPSSGNASALVRVSAGATNVGVAQGQMSVLNSSGNLLARVNAGLAVAYDGPQRTTDPQESKVQLTGKLRSSEGHLLLLDNATQIVWELVGKVPADQVGKTITVLATVLQERPAAGAEKVGRVETVKKAVGGFPCFGGGGEPGAEHIQLTGPIEKTEGHYLLTDKVSKVTSELVGSVPEYKDGTVVTVKGVLVKNHPPFPAAVQVVKVEHSKQGAGILLTGCQEALIAGLAVTAIGGSIAGWELSQGPPPQVSQ